MMVCWVLLLVLMLSSGEVSSSSSSSSSSSPGATEAPKVHSCTTSSDRVACVEAGDSVTVCCPAVSGNLVDFILLAGRDPQREEVHTYRNGSDPTTSRSEHRGMGVSVEVHPQQGVVSYLLSRVSVESAGFYSCQAKVWEPIPVKKTPGPNVLVHIEEPQCTCPAEQTVNVSRCEPQAVTCPAAGADAVPAWVWVMGTAVLGTYGLTVTIIAMVVWLRLRQMDVNHSEYMNTKPRRPPRGHKNTKNTRVQHPSIHF